MLGGCKNRAETPQENSEISQTAAETTTAVTTTAEKVTAAKTETSAVTTEEAVPLTPLEEAQAWAENDPERFLYDLNGDGFPERLSFALCEGAWYLFFYEDTEVYDWYYCIRTNGRAYVCRDTDGRTFIAAYSDNDFVAGVMPYSASRYDFYSGKIKETCIAFVCDYFYPYWENDGETYCYYTYESDIFENYSGTVDARTAENLLAEYISGYELLDVIEMKQVDEGRSDEVSFNADTDFSEENRVELPEYEYKFEPIQVGYSLCGSDTENIVLRPQQVGGDFDFDILKKFENLTDIDFVCDNYMDEKAVIKTGEWCKRIKHLQVDVSAFDTVNTDFSAFENVETININGYRVTREELEFLKDMPKIKLIYTFFFADSAETFIPLSEMPSLEAIIDSGMGSCRENLSEEEREKVMELLPKDKYFLGMVK